MAVTRPASAATDGSIHVCVLYVLPAACSGITLSANQVERGTQLAKERGLDNAEFKVGDGQGLRQARGGVGYLQGNPNHCQHPHLAWRVGPTILYFYGTSLLLYIKLLPVLTDGGYPSRVLELGRIAVT